MMEKAEANVSNKPTFEKRLSVNSAKRLAKRYCLGSYKGYSKMDGYFYFKYGRVGDCTPSRTELSQMFEEYDIYRDVEININDKNLKFVKY